MGARTFYIYKYTNLLNSKVYIGQCTNIAYRKRAHKSRASKGEDGCPLFYKAIRKYGYDVFNFEVLEVIIGSQEDADNAEIKMDIYI